MNTAEKIEACLTHYNHLWGFAKQYCRSFHRLLSFLQRTMSCSTAKSCGFAFEKMALLDGRVRFYTAVRNATAEASRAGKLDIPIAAEDLRVLDKRIAMAQAKMRALAPCLRA